MPSVEAVRVVNFQPFSVALGDLRDIEEGRVSVQSIGQSGMSKRPSVSYLYVGYVSYLYVESVSYLYVESVSYLYVESVSYLYV